MTAAAAAFRAVAGVLAAGAEASGAFAQAELLRSIHACRGAGLHRLAAAQTRALRSIRELRADRPEFALAALTADVRDALAVAHALAGGAIEPEPRAVLRPAAPPDRLGIDPALIGTARREYAPVGELRLSGVLAEAILARSGYAGAITYLADERGALYTRADVVPGDAIRAIAAYEAAAAFGDAALPHRELCRSALILEAATASADGRLGAGRRVRAVRTGQPSRWNAGPIDARFREPLADQLARIAALDGDPAEARPAGWDLAFVEGALAGGPTGIGLRTPRGPAAGEIVLRLSTTQHRALPGRDNLVVLSRAAGLRVRVIGRVRVGAPRELHLLAIGPAPGEGRFAMPDAWRGRANVHYDRISMLAIPDRDAPAAAAAPAPPAEDLLAPLRRRVERAVLGGAGTLPTQALAELEREAAALAERALAGGAEVLRDLAAIAHDTGRTPAGARRGLDPTAFAHAWLRAALYEDAARRRLSVASW